MAQVSKSAVSIRIGGDDLDPEEITKLVGTSPSSTQVKGEKIIGKKTGTIRIAKSGMWLLRVVDREPEDLDGQILEILGKMTSDLAVWKTITERFQVDFFCGLFLKESNEGLTISATTITALGERGIEIGLDIYGLSDDEGPDA